MTWENYPVYLSPLHGCSAVAAFALAAGTEPAGGAAVLAFDIDETDTLFADSCICNENPRVFTLTEIDTREISSAEQFFQL